MDTQFQDLQWVIDRSIKDFKTKKNRRVSSLYRDLRGNKKYSLFGDYFILWAIAKAMQTLHIERKRKPFWNAARQSKEFRETPLKGKWLDTLVGDLS